MSFNLRSRSYQGIAARREMTKVNRREVVRMAGGLGLATAGLLAFGRRSNAQEASPQPVATPVVGPQADGTTLWKVVVGGMDMQNMIEYHGFFPGEITINAGDSIWFAEEMPMFHTITFPGPGEIPSIFIPDPEVAPATPATAGPPKLIYNPILLTGAGGTVVDGSQLVSTGADVFGDGSTPWIFSFPKAGTYDYACIPHVSVMRAKVIVQEAGSALPLDQAGVDAAAAEQIAALNAAGLAEIEKYSQAVATKRDDGTTLWEVALGAGGTSQTRVQRILLGELEITAGDTVRYTIQSEGEPHTVSLIGAGETPPEDTLVETFADGSPKFVQNMETFLPQGGNVWSGTGWLSSGFMGIPQLGLAMEYEITFDTAGDYIPYCALHGSPTGEGMASKLSVKATG
jgi:plastocyanin